MSHATRPRDLTKLLPHRPPMLLLDAVLGADQNQLRALVQIRNETAFCESDGVPTVLSLEYLGQAAAAFFGFIDSPAPAGNPGMLIACNSLQVDRPFFVPDCDLLVRIVASGGLTESSTLVKFTGEIAVVEPSMQPATTELAQQDTAWPSQPAAAGGLSVYLPPSPHKV